VEWSEDEGGWVGVEGGSVIENGQVRWGGYIY